MTTTKTGVSTTTTTPVKTVAVTETWILPTPTAYKGMFSFNRYKTQAYVIDLG
jgi:hypothetical protein